MQFVDIYEEATKIEKLVKGVFSGKFEEGQIRDLFIKMYENTERDFGNVYFIKVLDFSKKQGETLDSIKNLMEKYFLDDQYQYNYNILLTMEDMSKNANYDDVDKNLRKLLKDDIKSLPRIYLKKEQDEVEYDGYNSRSAVNHSVSESFTIDMVNYVTERQGITLKEHLLRSLNIHLISILINNNNYILSEQLDNYNLSVVRNEHGEIVSQDKSLLEHPVFTIMVESPLFGLKGGSSEKYEALMKEFLSNKKEEIAPKKPRMR